VQLRGHVVEAYSKVKPYDYVNLHERLRNIAITGAQVKAGRTPWCARVQSRTGSAGAGPETAGLAGTLTSM
jgi:hypothetical protein